MQPRVREAIDAIRADTSKYEHYAADPQILAVLQVRLGWPEGSFGQKALSATTTPHMQGAPAQPASQAEHWWLHGEEEALTRYLVGCVPLQHTKVINAAYFSPITGALSGAFIPVPVVAGAAGSGLFTCRGWAQVAAWAAQ